MIKDTQLKKLCYDYESDKTAFIWNMREFLARHNAIKIWGNGFRFETNDKNIEKTFNRLNKLNRLDNLFSFVERECSKYGRSIITLNKSKSGDVLLNVSNPFYFNGIGKVFVQPQLAVIWQRFVIDNKTYIIKTTYDTEKVVNEFYNENNDQIMVYDETVKIMDELQIEREWKHNLGFVPVVEITNIPFFQQWFNNLEFVTLADWFPASKFEELAYSTYVNLIKELNYCHSRLVFENANQDLINQIKNSFTNNGEAILDDFIIETEMGSEFKVMVGNGDFTKYTTTLNNIFDFYCKLAGVSRFSEGGGAQKTMAETSAIRSAMIETINQKISLRTEQMTDLIRKMLCASGVNIDYWDDNNEFKFTINENIIKDDSSYIDNQLKLVDAGVISIPDVMVDLFNLTKQQAQDKFKEIQEFNKENGINDLEQLLEQDNTSNEEQINEIGEHADKPAMRGEA